MVTKLTFNDFDKIVKRYYKIREGRYMIELIDGKLEFYNLKGDTLIRDKSK
jgi:hypothetical protein